MSEETNKEEQIKEISREEFVNSLSLFNLKSSFKSVFEKDQTESSEDNFEGLISNIEEANTENTDNKKE